MHKQKGVTLIGMLFIGTMVVFAALVAMRMVPAYIEYFSIKKIFAAMTNDVGMKDMSVKEIRDSYERRAGIDNVTVIKPEDLEISKEDGGVVMEVSYSVKKPIAGNVSIVMDFNVSTAKGQ